MFAQSNMVNMHGDNSSQYEYADQYYSDDDVDYGSTGSGFDENSYQSPAPNVTTRSRARLLAQQRLDARLDNAPIFTPVELEQRYVPNPRRRARQPVINTGTDLSALEQALVPIVPPENVTLFERRQPHRRRSPSPEPTGNDRRRRRAMLPQEIEQGLQRFRDPTPVPAAFVESARGDVEAENPLFNQDEIRGYLEGAWTLLSDQEQQGWLPSIPDGFIRLISAGVRADHPDWDNVEIGEYVEQLWIDISPEERNLYIQNDEEDNQLEQSIEQLLNDPMEIDQEVYPFPVFTINNINVIPPPPPYPPPKQVPASHPEGEDVPGVEGLTCAICLENKTQIVARCGHLCACIKCSKGVCLNAGTCPMCREPWEDLRRVFFCA